MLRAERRAIDDQYRGGSCDDIYDSDDGLLAHGTRDVARQRQKRGTERSETERVSKARRTCNGVSVGEGNAGAEGRQLGQCEIGEDNLPAQHVNAEVRMDQDEDDRGSEGKRQERERLAYPAHGLRAPKALAMLATL